MSKNKKNRSYRFLNKIAKIIKNEPYKIDSYISRQDLSYFLIRRSIMIARGLVFLRKKIFIGKRVKLHYKHNITFGKYVNINDGVEIDALSKHGIVIGKNVSIGRNSTFRCTATLNKLGDGLVIGDNVGIGSNAY